MPSDSLIDSIVNIATVTAAVVALTVSAATILNIFAQRSSISRAKRRYQRALKEMGELRQQALGASLGSPKQNVSLDKAESIRRYMNDLSRTLGEIDLKQFECKKTLDELSQALSELENPSPTSADLDEG